MKKWICMSDECHLKCEVGSMEDEMIPHKCPYISTHNPQWVKMEENKGFVEKALHEAQEKIAGKTSALPKLTAEVFDRHDCPAWAQWAAVDKCQKAMWYEDEPKACSGIFWNSKKGQIDEIPGKWDATDWRNSLIERPAKLPDWVEVGEWVYCTQTGNYGKVHAIDETNADICINNNEVFPVKTKAILQNGKPARLRPYTADEMKALIGKVVFYSTNAYMCVNFHAGDNATVDYGPYRHTAKDLLEYGATIDGKPAGVFEHLENGEWGK